MKNVYLMATVANGVESVDIMDCPDADILKARTFIDSLDDLGDDEVIYTVILPNGTDGVFELIDAKYGIR